MNFKIKIIFTYTDEKYARIAYESLYPDNEGFVESYVENENLVCMIENNNISTVLNSIEDLIQCEKMVEMTSKIV